MIRRLIGRVLCRLGIHAMYPAAWFGSMFLVCQRCRKVVAR